MRRMHVIAKQQAYLDNIAHQLEEIFGDKYEFMASTLQEITLNTIAQEDVVVISKDMYRGIIEPFIPSNCPVIIVEREINIVGTQRIFDLPKGENILVISDTAEHAEETVKSLESIYFEHHYSYYDPYKALPEDIHWIVTPGEKELVPNGFENVIDIGPRGVAFRTVIAIAKLLNEEFEEHTLMNRFFKSHLGLTKTEGKAERIIQEVDREHREVPQLDRFKKTLEDDELTSMVQKIEEHGFLEESILILAVYQQAKKSMRSIGRSKVKAALGDQAVHLSEQQLRLRLEVMQALGLLIARQGRGGTRISGKGEQFLARFNGKVLKNESSFVEEGGQGL